MKETKEKIECKNCKHKEIKFDRENWQWCEIKRQYNWNGKCKHYEEIEQKDN